MSHSESVLLCLCVNCFFLSRCVRILGKLENIRVVQLSLFQGVAKAMQAAPTIEMKASDNPALQSSDPDPTIFCTAFKKNRFYMVWFQNPIAFPMLSWSFGFCIYYYSDLFLGYYSDFYMSYYRAFHTWTRVFVNPG